MEISLSEFIRETQERLDRFEKYWKQESKKDSDMFPLRMQSGEWDEQFQIFDETEA